MDCKQKVLNRVIKNIREKGCSMGPDFRKMFCEDLAIWSENPDEGYLTKFKNKTNTECMVIYLEHLQQHDALDDDLLIELLELHGWQMYMRG